MSAEYHFSVRQVQVKNFLYSLGVGTLVLKGAKVSEALSKKYNTLLKLSTQCPISLRDDAHKIALLHTAVVV